MESLPWNCRERHPTEWFPNHPIWIQSQNTNQPITMHLRVRTKHPTVMGLVDEQHKNVRAFCCCLEGDCNLGHQVFLDPCSCSTMLSDIPTFTLTADDLPDGTLWLPSRVGLGQRCMPIWDPKFVSSIQSQKGDVKKEEYLWVCAYRMLVQTNNQILQLSSIIYRYYIGILFGFLFDTPWTPFFLLFPGTSCPFCYQAPGTSDTSGPRFLWGFPQLPSKDVRVIHSNPVSKMANWRPP